MKILVLDNYDSFTYNLVHILRELGYENRMDIVRNDKITLEEAAAYDKILLSPGPGLPDEAGIMQDIIRTYSSTKSILGVCLGHQGIAEVFGAQLYNMEVVQHGIQGWVQIEKGDYLFVGMPERFHIAHYHSWCVVSKSVTDQLEIIATDPEGRVMGIRHRRFDVRGVQFHPESIVTENGTDIIKNWVEHKNKK